MRSFPKPLNLYSSVTDPMNPPDPFLLEALRKARERCSAISKMEGDTGVLAQVMDVLLFAEERSAIERSEMLNLARDLPQRQTQLEKKFDDFENGTIGELRRGLADAIKRVSDLETERAIKSAVKSTEEKATERWLGLLRAALIVTWTAVITGGSLFAFVYKAVPRESAPEVTTIPQSSHP